jgi:tRNA threonylcarbamoyladenosine biosynthesis protein TsaB
MFHGILHKNKLQYGGYENTLFCPMLDARRMEIYYAMYNTSGQTVKTISAEIITEDSFSNFPESKKIIFFGDGAEKCMEIIKRKNSFFDNEFLISAAHMHNPVYESIKRNHFENVAYFEPFYLKDFITSTPRKNILGTQQSH